MLRTFRFFLPMLLVLAACAGNNSGDRQDEASYDKEVVEASQEYDIREEYELRSGPGADHPRKINQKASDMLGEIHYLSVDPSVTIKILAIQGDWAELQVTQPEHLRSSHIGWIPKTAINYDLATNKLDGWIRYACHVYRSPSASGEPVGYLSSPASVGVADDGSGWLKLIHGPIKDATTKDFLENPNFEDGLYIERDKFTTEIPINWR